MNPTPIGWTDYSSNSLKYRDPDGNIVHACVHKSGGCSKCYAEALAGRWGRKGLPFTAENMKRLTPFMDEKEIRAILTCKAASGKRCFPFDMTDLAGEWIPDALIDQAFAFMALRPDIEFQILTKRIERLLEYVGRPGVAGDVSDMAQAQFTVTFKPSHPIPAGIKVYPMGPIVDGQPEFGHRWFTPWPLPNVLIGTSVEDQANLDQRYPSIAQIKQLGWRTFLSLEPLLGPLDLGFGRMPDVDWVIIGGESGHNARPFDIAWARSAIQQCRDGGVVPFMKQVGSNPQDSVSNAESWPEWRTRCHQITDEGDQSRMVIRLKSSHGTDMAEWPESLRHQEWPSK